MKRQTLIARNIALAFGGTLLAFASLPVSADQTLEKVEITGSAIKRVQAEGPAPVEIYTRKDVERTGATSVKQVRENMKASEVALKLTPEILERIDKIFEVKEEED